MPESNTPLAVSVIIPASDREPQLRKTLLQIAKCDPQPAETLVHVDGVAPQVVRMLMDEFPHVGILKSADRQGPGGSRNLLVAAARHDLVANFDDDSFPLDTDFFARVLNFAALFPEAAILSAANHDDARETVRYTAQPMASGCGCVFRKSWYERSGGFVPLPIAYGMEEADMGLRLHAIGGVVVRDDELRVLHDKPPPLSLPTAVNAAILANTALLPFLRFPVWLWPIGMWQVLSRIRYLLGRGWTNGIGSGLMMIPGHLQRYVSWRRVQPVAAIFSWLYLRRHQRPLTPTALPPA